MLGPNDCSIVLFLDFSSAFDTVDHHLLLYKLCNLFCVKDNALKWFESFLEDRCFGVTIEDVMSSLITVNHGVPQGSVLGPILFSLYTQDIYKIVSSYGLNLHIFADDIQIYLHCDRNNDKLQLLQKCFNDIKQARTF